MKSILFAINPSGSLKWEKVIEVGSTDYFSSPVVDSDNTIYIVVNNDIEAFKPIQVDDLSQQDLKWRLDNLGDSNALGSISISLSENGLLWLSDGSKVYAIE